MRNECMSCGFLGGWEVEKRTDEQKVCVGMSTAWKSNELDSILLT